MARKLNRVPAIILCAVLVLSSCKSRGDAMEQKKSESSEMSSDAAVEQPVPDTSFETVAGWIDLIPPRKLIVAKPSADISVNAEYYYITGCSNPAEELLYNGQVIDNRGKYGSFGVYAELTEGRNVFTFSQGENTRSVSIIRTSDEDVSATDIITKPSPASDTVIRSGDDLILSCVAPSGSTVTARIEGETLELKQKAITEYDGIPALYTAVYSAETIDGVTDIGPVSYQLLWDGETTDYESVGSILVAGKDDVILISGRDAI